MTTKMTERDKKLLLGLGIFCALALFAFLVFRPLYLANEAMKGQIEENELRIMEIQRKATGLPLVMQEHETIQEQLSIAGQDLYPRLKIQEIDRLLTEKTTEYGLSARRLQVTMPEESASVTGFDWDRSDESNPDRQDGIWIAQVSLEAAGSMTNMDRLVDELTEHMPGIRITEIRWSSERRTSNDQTGLTQQYDILNLQLQVLMSGKE